MSATTAFNLKLPAGLLDEAKQRAHAEDRSVSSLVREAVRQYLATGRASNGVMPSGDGARTPVPTALAPVPAP